MKYLIVFIDRDGEYSSLVVSGPSLAEALQAFTGLFVGVAAPGDDDVVREIISIGKVGG